MPTDIDTGDYRFLSDDTVGIRLVFASIALLHTRGEKTPLWWCEFPTRDYRNAMCAWVGARRDKWSAWGQLAETEGHDALGRHILDLSETDPLETPQGVVLAPGDDPRDLDLSILLGELHAQPIHRHRFRSIRARSRFLDWFYTDDHHAFGWVLAEIGLLQGTVLLGTILDDLASPRRKLAA